MDFGKYIIIAHLGCKVPILFSNLQDHQYIARDDAILSAGFFEVISDNDEIKVNVFGGSTVLKVKSGKEDAEIIKRILSKKNPFTGK